MTLLQVDGASLSLAAVLDLGAAGPLAQSLLAHRGRPVEIDGGKVQRLGGQCLQVLLSAEKTWAADGRGFALVNASADLRDALGLFGVDPASALLSSPVQEREP